MNPKIMTKSHTFLFLKRAFKLGMNGSFLAPADEVGGVGGLSLKKNIIKVATIVPIIA